MGKIKLNLVSGAIVEKPLVCAFKANNMEYIVLDNEMNGSMGLPIILVCKLENGRLIKIQDQNEWQIVKEYLKNIIAGSQVELVKVNSEMPADDIYYTQLTLPVPSFDALKKAYNIDTVEGGNNESASVNPGASQVASPEVNVAPTPEVSTPVAPSPEEASVNPTPVVDVNPAPVGTPEVSIANTTPTPTDPVSPAVNIDTPVVETPTNEVNTQAASPAIDLGANIAPSINPEVVNNSVPEQAPNVSPVEPQPVVTPTSPVVNPTVSEDIFKDQKEAFMQACENMFDALVQKFEREIENHK